VSKLAALCALTLASSLSLATQGCAADAGSDDGEDGTAEELGSQDGALRRGGSGIEGRVLDTDEIASLLRDAGVPEASIPKMVCTAYYESKWRDRSWNWRNGNGTIDRGLFQINSAHLKGAYRTTSGERISAGLCSDMQADDLWDVAKNAECAQKIFREQGLSAWYGYKAHRRTLTSGGIKQLGCDVYKLGDVIESRAR
jgi:hypothetical protein